MCTVSIVPDGDGFRLMSNRDERRDRANAIHPRVDTLGSRAVLMPIDPVGGGSWIGVNDAGLVAAVLNRHDGRPAAPRPCASRGLIVRQALECDDAGAAVASVRTLDAARFHPFRLVVAQKGRIALISGDERGFAFAESTLDRPYMFTASSLGDVFVDGPRRRLFDCLMHHVSDRLLGQQLFHQHQWADKRDISVLMERADAATVSRTIVAVGDGRIAFEYESLLPCASSQRLALQPC